MLIFSSSHPSFVGGFVRNRWGSLIPILSFMHLKLNGKKNNIWLIMHIISYRLPVRITSDCDLNVSWRTKEKTQRITALLPWSPQFPLVKRSLIVIFVLVRWRVLMSIVCLRIEDHFYIRISIVVIVSRNFFIYLFICFP